jgi:hypothetical protein
MPIAMPVKAECPSPSAKKAILLDTTIVENNPKSGVINNMPINAF